MATKKYSAEQAVVKRRQIDVLVGEGKSIKQACKGSRDYRCHLFPLAAEVCGSEERLRIPVHNKA